jgi:hypothetical protein
MDSAYPCNCGVKGLRVVFAVVFRIRRITDAISAAAKITQQPAPIQNHRRPSGMMGPKISLRPPNQPPINNIHGTGSSRVIITAASTSTRCGALTGPLPTAAITASSQCVRNIVAALPARKPANRHVYVMRILSMIYHFNVDSNPPPHVFADKQRRRPSARTRALAIPPDTISDQHAAPKARQL